VEKKKSPLKGEKDQSVLLAGETGEKKKKPSTYKKKKSSRKKCAEQEAGCIPERGGEGRKVEVNDSSQLQY